MRIRQTDLAGHDAFSDRPQRRLHGGPGTGVAFICIAGEAFLPRVVLDSLHLSPLWPYAGAPVALLSVAALVVLWTRRRSMLDLWLMVVMCLYTIEIPLSYYPDPVRFSVGWYTVRVIGFFSSSLVLFVLLYEIETLYARLFGAVLLNVASA